MRPLFLPTAALALIGTLATSCPPPNYGMSALCQHGSSLFALFSGNFYAEEHRAYVSQDGGLSWSPTNIEGIEASCTEKTLNFNYRDAYRVSEWQVTSPQLALDIVPNDAIYVIESDGERHKEFDLAPLNSEPRKVFFQGSAVGMCGLPFYSGNPLDALIDLETGNAVLTMGTQGVLVRSVAGVWEWVSVGRYVHIEPDLLGNFPQILKQELSLALGLFLLIPGTLTVNDFSLGFRIIRMLGWLGWFGLILNQNTFRFEVATAPPFVFLILFLWITSWAWVMMAEISKRLFFANLLIALAAVGLFLFPYFLWLLGTIPSRTTSFWFALILAVTVMVAGRIQMERLMPPVTAPELPSE